MRTVRGQPRLHPRLFLALLGDLKLFLGFQTVCFDPFQLSRFFLLLPLFLRVTLQGSFQRGLLAF